MRHFAMIATGLAAILLTITTYLYPAPPCDDVSTSNPVDQGVSSDPVILAYDLGTFGGETTDSSDPRPSCSLDLRLILVPVLLSALTCLLLAAMFTEVTN